MSHRLVSERRFGVEIECGMRGGWGSVDAVVGDLPGVDSVGSDGSGAEVRVGPLQGHEGFKTLENILTTIKENEGYVSLADGCHVHHEALDFMQGDEGWARTERLVKSWKRADDAINSLVIPRRTMDYWACPKILKGEVSVPDDSVPPTTDHWGYTRPVYKRMSVEQAIREKKLGGLERGDLNINNVLYALKNGGRHATYEAPTIELRIHEGTLDYATLRAWIEFGQRLIDHAAAGKTLRTCADAAVMFRRIGLYKQPTAILLDKATRVRAIEDDLRANGHGFEDDYEERGYCGNCDTEYYYDEGCRCQECDRCWDMFGPGQLVDYYCSTCRDIIEAEEAEEEAQRIRDEVEATIEAGDSPYAL